MSRVIKFRAWDKYENKLGRVVGIEWVNDGFDIRIEHPDAVMGKKVVSRATAPLMQFTGLLDKNGREIWEGDLVRWLPRMRPRIVAWFDGFYGVAIRAVDGSLLIDNSLMDKLRNVEVIGNIYENPELLQS